MKQGAKSLDNRLESFADLMRSSERSLYASGRIVAQTWRLFEKSWSICRAFRPSGAVDSGGNGPEGACRSRSL